MSNREASRRAVLAIDAAWTANQPSGIALVHEDEAGRWRCAALAPSYASFDQLAVGKSVDWNQPCRGTVPNSTGHFAAARQLLPAGDHVLTVSIDMPMASTPILGRRSADNEITRRFGAAGCGTHSPSPSRPGALGRALADGFLAAGLQLAVHPTVTTPDRGLLIEVYPHPALLALLGISYRLPYKVSRSSRYWPGLDVPGRIERLLKEFERILSALQREIDEIPLVLPDPPSVRSLSTLKRYEDALDALVSAWVGIQVLLGRAEAFGDETAAIWCPRSPAQEQEVA